jgi:hypothetical protein
MEVSWRALLARLKMTDAEVYTLVAQTCRTQARFRYSVSDELIGTIFSEVVVRLCRKYQVEPEQEYFGLKPLFEKAIRTTATRSYDKIVAPRRHRDDVMFGEMDTRHEPAAPVEKPTRELDCPRICGRCLDSGSDKQKEMFMAICEGIRHHGHPPAYKELIPRMGKNKTDVCRLWKQICSLFRRSSCGDPDTFLDWE